MEDRGYYEVVYHPQKDGTSKKEFTHRMVMRNKVGMYKGVIHHKDFNKLNNDPRNLLRTDFVSHRKYHAEKGGLHFKEFNKKYRNGEISQETLDKMQEGRIRGIRSRWSNPEAHEIASKKTSKRMAEGQAKDMSMKALEKPGEIERRSKKMVE